MQTTSASAAGSCGSSNSVAVDSNYVVAMAHVTTPSALEGVIPAPVAASALPAAAAQQLGTFSPSDLQDLQGVDFAKQEMAALLQALGGPRDPQTLRQFAAKSSERIQHIIEGCLDLLSEPAFSQAAPHFKCHPPENTKAHFARAIEKGGMQQTVAAFKFLWPKTGFYGRELLSGIMQEFACSADAPLRSEMIAAFVELDRYSEALTNLAAIGIHTMNGYSIPNEFLKTLQEEAKKNGQLEVVPQEAIKELSKIARLKNAGLSAGFIDKRGECAVKGLYAVSEVHPEASFTLGELAQEHIIWMSRKEYWNAVLDFYLSAAERGHKEAKLKILHLIEEGKAEIDKALKVELRGHLYNEGFCYEEVSTLLDQCRSAGNAVVSEDYIFGELPTYTAEDERNESAVRKMKEAGTEKDLFYLSVLAALGNDAAKTLL